MTSQYSRYPSTSGGGGGSGITDLTGDVTATGPGSAAATIAAGAVTSAKIGAGAVTLTTKVAGILPVANGGTNSSTTLNNNRVMKSSGGAVVEAAAIAGNKALASDVNGIPVATAVTDTELGYVSGVTSAVQTQLNAKQATGNYVTALTGDVTAAGPGSVAATVAQVGGKTAAAVATSVTDTVAATNLNTVSTIVKRDGSGNFSAGTITAALSGNATSATTATTAGNVSGTVAIANGGTGQITANAALNALLPSQGTASGKFLSSNGTNSSWTAAASATLNQYNIDIGDSSNARTATNTNLLGTVAATTTSQAYTVTSAAPGVFTVTGHGFATGDKAYVTATQNGFTANTTYWVHKIDANTFHLSTTYANAIGAVYITSSGTTAGTIVSGGLVVVPGPATNRAPTQSVATTTSHSGGMSANTTGTYTTPANVAWIRIRLVGGGGGGSAGGTSVNVAATAGGTTSFGSSLIAAGGGSPGGVTEGGAGGVNTTFNAPAAGFQVSGGDGGASAPIRLGGIGGSSALGGAGRPGTVLGSGAGGAGKANTGGGGGGGDGGGTQSGAGGGGGCFMDVIIEAPASSYSYTVGAGGTAGTANGGDGAAGGAGGSGIIIVEEHYY